MKETNQWSADHYNRHASFVSDLALPVVDLLDPIEGEKILDLGCGEGKLAIEIERSGAKVTAVDLSEDMVEKARARGLDAHRMRATEFPFINEFDAVFSNAVLHWVKESESAVKHIHRALKERGRFIAEFGGEGNMHTVVEAIEEVFRRHPEFGAFRNPWYFPSVEAYRDLLEACGFEVAYIEQIPRPTPIDDIAHWLDVFANGIVSHLREEQKVLFNKEVRKLVRSKLYDDVNGWQADYVRLRVQAFKR